VQEHHNSTEVVLINFENLKIDRNTAFKDVENEKKVLGLLRAAVERWLTKKRLVILDSLNFIKGFRYELYCRAREVGTPHCVVFCDVDQETSRKWNDSRLFKKHDSIYANESESKQPLSISSSSDIKYSLDLSKLSISSEQKSDLSSSSSASISSSSSSSSTAKITTETTATTTTSRHSSVSNTSSTSSPSYDGMYNPQCMDDLLNRLEVPNADKRWDAPLFTVKATDETPCKDIIEAVLLGKAPTPSFATAIPKLEANDFVHQLDRVTQDVVKLLLDAQNVCQVGDVVMIPNGDKKKEKVNLSRALGLPELRGLRRQYLKIAALRPPKDSAEVITAFCDFLNSQM
jgi:protein KTI12